MATGGTAAVSTEPEAAPQQEKSVARTIKGENGKENDKDEREEENEARPKTTKITAADAREYACHGLGKAIDATAIHPWESRSPYEARAVTPSDAVVLYEGMRVHQYTEQIDSYYDMQGSIETSLKIPNKPIEMGVAADASRSSWFSKLVRGKKVLKSTIAFDRKAPVHSSGRNSKKSNFERDLERWLLDKESVQICDPSEVTEEDNEKLQEQVRQCISSIRDRVGQNVNRESVKKHFEKDHPPPSSSDSEAAQAHEKKVDAKMQAEVDRMLEKELSKLCKQFLLSLGGITHYISSITLGAMEYSQSKLSSKKVSFSQSTTIGVERVTTSKAKVSGSKSLDKMSRNSEKLGRFEYDEGGITDYIRDREEAVVHYAFTPLSSLVKRPDLCEAVQQAIHDYSNEQLSTCSGPYLISCTEPLDGYTLYWKVEREQPTTGRFVIKLTSNYKDASQFYIELDRSKAGFFFITTTDDPTESITSDHEKNRPKIKRYVHMELHSPIPYLRFGRKDITLAAYATVVSDSAWTSARFEVVDHQSHRRRSLQQSDWLPGKGRLDKSQPCFLSPRLHLYCLAVMRRRQLLHRTHDQEPRAPTYNFRLDGIRNHREGKCHMLFTLTHPPTDYDASSDTREAKMFENSSTDY